MDNTATHFGVPATIWGLRITHNGVEAVFMTVSEIIDSLGGPAAVARAADVPAGTASNWKARGSIPARHHAAVIRAGKGTITAEMLVLAHASARPTPEGLAA